MLLHLTTAAIVGSIHAHKNDLKKKLAQKEFMARDVSSQSVMFEPLGVLKTKRPKSSNKREITPPATQVWLNKPHVVTGRPCEA